MKLFASIVTTGKFWDNRTKACLETWLPKFDDWLFCTDTKNDEHCFGVTDRTDYGSCKGKQLNGFKICQDKFSDYDWFFACADDTCVNVENLRRYCESLSLHTLAIFGQGIFWDFMDTSRRNAVWNTMGECKNFFYLSGGAGHLMNLATLKVFNETAKTIASNDRTNPCADIAFGEIANIAKISQIESPMFHSQPPGFYPKDDPKKAISYHYISPDKMKETYEAMVK
jgi:hypothetical protein